MVPEVGWNNDLIIGKNQILQERVFAYTFHHTLYLLAYAHQYCFSHLYCSCNDRLIGRIAYITRYSVFNAPQSSRYYRWRIPHKSWRIWISMYSWDAQGGNWIYSSAKNLWSVCGGCKKTNSHTEIAQYERDRNIKRCLGIAFSSNIYSTLSIYLSISHWGWK